MKLFCIKFKFETWQLLIIKADELKADKLMVEFCDNVLNFIVSKVIKFCIKCEIIREITGYKPVLISSIFLNKTAVKPSRYN